MIQYQWHKFRQILALYVSNTVAESIGIKMMTTGLTVVNLHEIMTINEEIDTVQTLKEHMKARKDVQSRQTRDSIESRDRASDEDEGKRKEMGEGIRGEG